MPGPTDWWRSPAEDRLPPCCGKRLPPCPPREHLTWPASSRPPYHRSPSSWLSSLLDNSVEGFYDEKLRQPGTEVDVLVLSADGKVWHFRRRLRPGEDARRALQFVTCRGFGERANANRRGSGQPEMQIASTSRKVISRHGGPCRRAGSEWHARLALEQQSERGRDDDDRIDLR